MKLEQISISATFTRRIIEFISQLFLSCPTAIKRQAVYNSMDRGFEKRTVDVSSLLILQPKIYTP